jgi:dihydrofolate reductase
MGRVILMMSVSLDGYVEGADRDIGWHRVDEELHRHFNAELAEMGAFLSGRVTHELMAAFWPTADLDPDSTPAMAEYAEIWRDKPKYVYSRTLYTSEWNTTVLGEVVPDRVRRLARAHGDLALGGATLAATFLRLGLVDEYRVYVHPVLLGAGRPLFPPGVPRTGLRLLDSHTFGSGVVRMRYRPEPPTA